MCVVVVFVFICLVITVVVGFSGFFLRGRGRGDKLLVKQPMTNFKYLTIEITIQMISVN